MPATVGADPPPPLHQLPPACPAPGARRADRGAPRWPRATGRPSVDLAEPARRRCRRRPTPTTRSPNSSGYWSASAMIVMPPIEWPTSTTGRPVGAAASMTAFRSRPSWSIVRVPCVAAAARAAVAALVPEDHPHAARAGRGAGSARSPGSGSSRGRRRTVSGRVVRAVDLDVQRQRRRSATTVSGRPRSSPNGSAAGRGRARRPARPTAYRRAATAAPTPAAPTAPIAAPARPDLRLLVHSVAPP